MTMDYGLGKIRHDYTRDEIAHIFAWPLPRLIKVAQETHNQYFADDEVQLCTLLSIKTGGCKEDCSYCPQSAHYQTDVKAHGLLDTETVRAAARAAKAEGATRFCMGAAWRSPPENGGAFEKVLASVRAVKDEGLEVCTTLGMLTREQAQRLKAAGVYAYNHNLDTSPEYYEKIISTRTYGDRLQTLRHVREAGMTVCCGGIIGLGESREDRVALIQELNAMDPHPESVPINLLIKVTGTPLADANSIDIFEMVRTVATTRIVIPKARVRLSAGRTEMSDEAQALCFVAGANSIFTGEKLLTTPNPATDSDMALLNRLGMRAVRATTESTSPQTQVRLPSTPLMDTVFRQAVTNG